MKFSEDVALIVLSWISIENFNMIYFKEIIKKIVSPISTDFWISRDIPRELHAPIKTMKNGGSTQECMDILRCFLSGFTGNFTKQDVQKTAKLLSTIYLMPFGKELWKNCLFEWKTKSRILEGMLTSCPGLEQLFFRYNISFIDPPLGWLGKILTLSDDISLGLKPSGNIITSG